MNHLQEYNFNDVYKLADLIDNSVKYDVEFWNYDRDFFIKAATGFSKDTLLHLYIVTTAVNYHYRDFRKNGDFIDEETMQNWYSLFESYSVKVKKINFQKSGDLASWLKVNKNKFEELFIKMADEAFYILFANRKFLLAFNNLVIQTIKEIALPKEYLTEKGTLKRKNIPKWVKIAIYHRDKGRCVFCNTDLTGLINTLTNSNYDHIVPLDLFGPNDPCNIQLACETCNKFKTNKDGSTSNKYIPWWTK